MPVAAARCSLTLARLRFFALETIAQSICACLALTQPHTCEQWMWEQKNQDRQPKSSGLRNTLSRYNIRMSIPPEIRGQKYISLITFRKMNGRPYSGLV